MFREMKEIGENDEVKCCRLVKCCNDKNFKENFKKNIIFDYKCR